MKNFEDLINHTQLSFSMADAIARSQHDLGLNSQEDMRIALSGLSDNPTNTQARINAFVRLDVISQFIVYIALGGLNNELLDDFFYIIDCLTKVKKVCEDF